MTALASPPVVEVRAGRREWAALAVMCSMMLILSVDGTALNVALPTLVAALHPSSGGLQWIVDSYIFTNAVLVLVGGALADRFGRRRFFLTGLSVFGAASLGCALVHSTALLIAMRTTMGVGAAILMPASLSIIAAAFTGAQRAQAIGIWAGVSGIGTAAGPLLGGWLLAHFWWGSVFLINVPIVAVGLIGGWFVIQESRSDDPLPLDPVAALLSAAGLAALTYAIIVAPTDSWGSPTVLGCLGASVVLLLAFVRWDRGREHPYVDFSLFRNPVFSVALGAVSVTFFAMFAVSFMFSQELQFVQGYGVLAVGVRFLPLAVATVVLSNIAAGMTARFGLRRVMIAAMLLVLSGLVTLTTLTSHSGYLPLGIAMALLGGGVSLAVAPASNAIVGTLPPLKLGAGSGLRSCVQLLGGSFGIAVLGSLTTSRYRSVVHAAFGTSLRGLPAAARGSVADQVGSAAQVIPHLPAGLARTTTQVTHQAFLSGVRLSAIVGACLIALVIIPIARFIPRQVTPGR